MDFKRFHFVYSHKFEGDVTEQGWIGMTLKLDKALDENYTLGNFYKDLYLFNIHAFIFISVIWVVNNVELSIDKFFRVEKAIL